MTTNASTSMQAIRARALDQAKLDANIQQMALDTARYNGDSAGVVYFRNARDRNRLAIRWIKAH